MVPIEGLNWVHQHEGESSKYPRVLNIFCWLWYTSQVEILQLHDVICKVPLCSFRCGSLQSTSCKRVQAFQVALEQSPQLGSSDSEKKHIPTCI